jgi:hypothetical protein
MARSAGARPLMTHKNQFPFERSRTMKAKLATASIALMFLVGCNSMLVGTWTTEKVEPADSSFKIAKVIFNNDNTFESTSEYAKGNTETATGAYEWNGFQLKLTSGDTVRQYDAQLLWGKLVVKDVHEGQKVKMTMAKSH